ncbi:MAG: sigma-54 dependent transcriptional regulator [Gemmatimonadota bacterium]
MSPPPQIGEERVRADTSNPGAGQEGTGAERTIARLQRAHALGKLVGDAPAFRTAIARLPVIARADATVLLLGETGTGKELVARAIHYLSDRDRGSFTAVNCGALADTLLEDAFFGHARGAFTDAKTSRGGLLAQAHGGTLFLDEVDSLSPRAQVALLRVLQDRSYRALGSNEEQQADVRIVAASNIDLLDLVTQRTLRSDLYYRLSVLTITLPPLRERLDDILPLTHHFLLRMAQGDRPPPRLLADAKSALLRHDWPGNVRELENAVLRAVSLCEGDAISAADLGIRRAPSSATSTATPAPLHAPPVHARPPWTSESSAPASLPGEVEIDLSRSFGDLKRETVSRFEKAYLTTLLDQCDGNVSRAARRARKERRDFRRLLQKHALDPRAFERDRQSLDADLGGATAPRGGGSSPQGHR